MTQNNVTINLDQLADSLNQGQAAILAALMSSLCRDVAETASKDNLAALAALEKTAIQSIERNDGRTSHWLDIAARALTGIC